ncbi:hypothetical protein CVT25_004208 [Psilocybe cyanescens]|uniref:Endonuclease/exonuclease/phosphatase domain-containing protein n=1 Tax=Psilocybe cyanescens TaxID=93625 RepID=A0A409XW29_PSICY|nr:hypothetical protein CVT25_004208 [Psilocybe cyanescens]
MDRFADQVHFNDCKISHGDADKELKQHTKHLDKLQDKISENIGTYYAGTDASLPLSGQYQVIAASILFSGRVEHWRARHVAGKVTVPDAELYAICSAIVNVTSHDDCTDIFIFMDSMASAHRAVDPSIHSRQGHSVAVCEALQTWFTRKDGQSITFVYIPLRLQWDLHYKAHGYATKLKVALGPRPATSFDSLHMQAALSCGASWNILFQDPKYRGRNFLHLKTVDRAVAQPGGKDNLWVHFANMSSPQLYARMYETHTAALLLAEEVASLPPFIYMGGDFNIHSQEWDGGCHGHPGVATQLFNTAAELGLQRAPFVNLGPTFYPCIQGFCSTVIDLVFVQSDQTLMAQVTQVHNAMGKSDHIPLATTLLISADSGATSHRALKADREEQIHFVRVIEEEFAIKVDEYAPLDTPDQIDAVAQAIADLFSAAWETCSREVTIMRRSKPLSIWVMLHILHVRYYSTKALSTIKMMKMLGSSTRVMFGFCLWYFAAACCKGALHHLSVMQRSAALWITGSFHTSLTGGVEDLVGLPPINLLLRCLSERADYWFATLTLTHPVRAFLSRFNCGTIALHPSLSIQTMSKQEIFCTSGTLFESDTNVLALTETLLLTNPLS